MLGFVFRRKACSIDHSFGKFGKSRRLRKDNGKFRHQCSECGKLFFRPRKRRIILDIPYDFKHRRSGVCGNQRDVFYGRIAYPAFRYVDNTPERRFIRRVRKQAQIRHEVFDFFAVVEFHASENAVRDPHTRQHALNTCRYGIHSV